jgi:hypothetical protein
MRPRLSIITPNRPQNNAGGKEVKDYTTFGKHSRRLFNFGNRDARAAPLSAASF